MRVRVRLEAAGCQVKLLRKDAESRVRRCFRGQASQPCAFCLGSCYSHMHGVPSFPANAAPEAGRCLTASVIFTPQNVRPVLACGYFWAA
jgi:hypothetical protein